VLVGKNTVVIIDEVSMLSEAVLNVFIQRGCKLILVGDPDQLVVQKMFDYEPYKIFELTKNFRSKRPDIKTVVAKLRESVMQNKIPAIKSSEDVEMHTKFSEFVERVRDLDSLVLAYKNTTVERYNSLGLYSSTVHKAQGETFQTIAVDVTDILSSYTTNNTRVNKLEKEDMLKLLYVGISRAEQKVILFTGDSRTWANETRKLRR
jgi:ATP-dependent exoDNAse (exonuclease V) alpha subunit